MARRPQTPPLSPKSQACFQQVIDLIAQKSPQAIPVGPRGGLIEYPGLEAARFASLPTMADAHHYLSQQHEAAEYYDAGLDFQNDNADIFQPDPMDQPLPRNSSISPDRSSSASFRGTTRSGRRLNRSATKSPATEASRTRVAKSPKAQKAKATKGEKAKTPKLDKPLSELTKNLDVPLRDMEAWVNRPSEERQQEVARRNGYVTRPMNSFMLYRSAYAERTKVWCLQNNHQVVSAVSGESWPMEPVNVREFYNDLARAERVNHQLAHPNYKFSPSKAANAKKQKEDVSDEEDNSLTLDDPDAEWNPSGRRQAKSSRRSTKEATPSTQPTPIQQYPSYTSFDPNEVGNNSMWEPSEYGRPLPSAIEQHGMYGAHYHQTSVHPYPNAPWAEDVRAQRMEASGPQSYQPLLGFPSTHGSDFYGLPAQEPALVDHGTLMHPMLLGYGNDQSLQGLTGLPTSMGEYNNTLIGTQPSSHYPSHSEQNLAQPSPNAYQEHNQFSEYNSETWPSDFFYMDPGRDFDWTG